ncbi:5-oxoprolinase subunit PxpB [Paucilactobacillus suebicus]|uniref:Carboxyltransferase domain-containing protein n=1 Tax=Paucilactobacillus suebicus DSM 5007 = KCTC 3549 TaxID=1423807 RepID=A0A0R1W545_9LACO|nr:5-oxoprolinase subunit PxpB [Paucilactobacillus suebicus]KRM12762.1 hypothetical protein FD16_GL001940 [Paucilactobacillus suebicus DSM 5007 = KCTC 3549]
MVKFSIFPAGDSAVNVTFDNRVDPQINQFIRTLQRKLESQKTDGITALVPAFRTLTVFYNPELLSFNELTTMVQAIATQVKQVDDRSKKIIHIPVCYESSFGPDMGHIVEHSNLSIQEVIELHTKTDYLIYMLGFLPGFVYLGGLDGRLATPRLATPRLSINPGAVGIAGEQTGVYPIASPGGWQIIGQTPLNLFQPQNENPFYYQTGDYIHFDPITASEFDQISRLVDEDRYQVKVEEGTK